MNAGLELLGTNRRGNLTMVRTQQRLPTVGPNVNWKGFKGDTHDIPGQVCVLSRFCHQAVCVSQLLCRPQCFVHGTSHRTLAEGQSERHCTHYF